MKKSTLHQIIGSLLKSGETVLAEKLMNPIILDTARAYLSTIKDDWNYVLPKEYKEMREQNKDPFQLIDTRKPEDFAAGHIAGATNIFWLDILKDESLNKLSKDKPILVVCYVGHTASQVLVLLSLLGYKVKALKFGMGIPPTKGVSVAGWQTLGYEIVKGSK